MSTPGMSTPGMSTPAGLRVLVLDDEAPALDELTWLLRRDDRIRDIHATRDATEALGLLRAGGFDAVFLDVQMPGLDGVELATLLGRFERPPAVVFVTAHDEHAVAAFELHAVDYVLKPVREERLREAVRRVVEHIGPGTVEEETIAVELGGVTRFVRASEVRYVEAQGDYARLHTATESHLVRLPISALEERWAERGFVRIHRSLLVSMTYVEEVRTDEGRCLVVVDGTELQVSRRQAPALRELLRRSRPSAERGEP